MQLRWYQEQAVNSLFDYFYKSDGNPVIVLPTGSGKSLAIAEIVKRMNENWPDQRIMMCTHQKELIKQNYDELLGYYPNADAGIYSAGLNKKQTDHKVIFCGVQSAYKKAMHLGEFALMLVDECHLINTKDTGIYRKFIADLQKINPAMKVVGLSATPYRTKTGIITEGDDAIFTDICFEVGVAQLIQEGFLCPIISKNSVNRPDTSKVHIRSGEFIEKELQDIFDVDAVVTGAVKEISELAHDRKKIMVFCVGIEHAEHVTKELNSVGIKAECTHSKKSKVENDQIIDNFRDGRIRAIVNVDCLTTGFNVKDVDCIAMLRSTMSPGLYYQIAGRGLRIHPNKENCLFLDFGGNILRHGPIDQIYIKNNNGKREVGVAPMKECPNCHNAIYAVQMKCPECGYEYPDKGPNHEATASNLKAVSTWEAPKYYDVSKVSYKIHKKMGSADSLKVTYHIDMLNDYSEWVCLGHSGYAGIKAKEWWIDRIDRAEGAIVPNEAGLALLQTDELRQPKRILVDINGKYPVIKGYEF